MSIRCQKCGIVIGESSDSGASLKARRVEINNGRIRVKCAKCHTYTTVPGWTASRQRPTAGRRMVAIKLGG